MSEQPKRKRSGLTLVEVLVAVGIVVVLAGITVAVTGPVRENARQAECAQNLWQLHQAVLLYTEAYDSAAEIPGLDQLSGAVARSGAGVLKPYIKDENVLYCPDLPAAIKPKLATSYSWALMPSDAFPHPSPGERGILSKQMKQIEKLGTSIPMWVCEIHDEVYYQGQDSYVDDIFTQEYVVEISVAGKIFRGRQPSPRGTIIKAFENYPTRTREVPKK